MIGVCSREAKKRLGKQQESAAARLCDSIGYQGGMSASLRGGVVPERVENGRAAEEAGPLDGLQAASHPT